MDYKPCKTTCAVKGCGNERRPGQRTCRACHAEQERARRRKDSEARKAIAKAAGRWKKDEDAA